MSYGIGKVNTTRIQTKNFCGEGVFDPEKVWMKPDVNGKVYVNDILCSIVRSKEEAQIGSTRIAGKDYKTVKIGNLIWLAENLDYLPDGVKLVTANGESPAPGDTTAPGACYQSYDSSSTKGLLYNKAASKLINIPGWRVPTKTEMNTLTTIVGGTSNGLKLCSTSWSGATGTDEFGFCALQNGYRNSSLNAQQDLVSAYFRYLNANDSDGRWSINQSGTISTNDSLPAAMYSIRLVCDA